MYGFKKCSKKSSTKRRKPSGKGIEIALELLALSLALKTAVERSIKSCK